MFKRIFENNTTVGKVTVNVYICLQGRGGRGGGLENWSYDTHVLNGWLQTNAAFFVHWYGQVH